MDGDTNDYRQKFDVLFDEFEEVKAVCQSVYQTASDAKRNYEIAEATALSALKSTEGTVQEKKAKAELSCVELRKAKDDAEVLEKVLKLRFSALESQLSAIQSAAKTLQMEGALLGYKT